MFGFALYFKIIFIYLQRKQLHSTFYYNLIMNNNIKRWLVASVCCFMLGSGQSIMAQQVIFPQEVQANKAQLESNTNKWTLKNSLLIAKFAKVDGKLIFYGCKEMNLKPGTELFKVVLGNGNNFTSSDMELVSIETEELVGNKNAVKGSDRFDGKGLKAVFKKDKLHIVWHAVLRDGSHYLRTTLDVATEEDVAMQSITPMIYNVDCKKAKTAPMVVGNTRGAILASNKIFAGLETPMGVNSVEVNTKDNKEIPAEVAMKGYWRRNTTLKKNQPWEVSTVVGLIAPGQARRSFLAYSERERAVPWRAFPLYNSWYELNIDRNNAVGNSGVYDASDPNNTKGDYTENMTSTQCVDVVKHWKEKFYDVYGKAPYAFVFDDGWDAYGTWTFNPNFPNGFTNEDNLAKSMGVGIGAWLGPVGGYGGSGTYRRNYWNNRGGMQLSNESYYNYFIDCCKSMINNYDFRFFKFDGISAQGTAFGPDEGDTGIENAEGIISIEREVRKTRPDIFFNTTVGTWASPFWFHYSDAIWRQDADCKFISDTGTDREQWITYRDYMVYKIFTQGSPLCPINTLMTHGLILSENGKPYTPNDYSYDGVLREMRCAFGCGSGMVELYTDYKLMDEIKDNNGKAGALWKDLAECMDWQQRNADVLPDIHWVGGNPWDGTQVNVYGWASWNGKKATLTLRNPDVKERQFITTLREMLDIPAYIQTTITLSSSFADQKVATANGLKGIEMNKPIDIDKQLTLTFPASTVFVFEGVD